MVGHAGLLTVGEFLDGNRPAHDRVCAVPWHAGLLTWASAYTSVVAEKISILKKVAPAYIRLLPNGVAYVEHRVFRLSAEQNCHNSLNIDIPNDRQRGASGLGRTLEGEHKSVGNRL